MMILNREYLLYKGSDTVKKVLALIGSRRKNGNTAKFVNSICEKFDSSEVEKEIIFPQDLSLRPCLGCNECFINACCDLEDDMVSLRDKILKSDAFIIASPVYIHNISADLMLILERISWWTHILCLSGKPVVALSTCSGNGFDTVISLLEKYLTMMGGNVIVKKNASEFPHQIHSNEWLKQTSQEIYEEMNKYLQLPPQSSRMLERAFEINKSRIMEQMAYEDEHNVELGECRYWRESGMIGFNCFQDYLDYKFK